MTATESVAVISQLQSQVLGLSIMRKSCPVLQRTSMLSDRRSSRKAFQFRAAMLCAPCHVILAALECPRGSPKRICNRPPSTTFARPPAELKAIAALASRWGPKIEHVLKQVCSTANDALFVRYCFNARIASIVDAGRVINQSMYLFQSEI